MGRLIDADALIKKLKEKSIVDEVNIISTTYTYKELVYIICNLPTAFDVEKVVAEIKSQFGCKDCEYVDEFQHPACNECAELEVIDDICRIVRKGGVE